MAEVWASVPYEVTEQRLRQRHDKVALAGLDPAQVSRAARRLLAGEVLGRIHSPGERQAVPVRLHIPRERRVEVALLEQAFVTNPMGLRVPLSELVEVELAKVPTPIRHKNGERVHYVAENCPRPRRCTRYSIWMLGLMDLPWSEDNTCVAAIWALARSGPARLKDINCYG